MLAMVATFAFALTIASADGAVHPHMVDTTLAPGESVVVDKVIDTPVIPPKPDICFLSDTTGSMGGAIANVQANATAIMNSVVASQPSAQFCAGEYKDPGTAINQDLTGTIGTVQTAINGWGASGGGDTPEAQLAALHNLANNVSWRAGSTRIIVWFGDASGHDPSSGITLASATAALTGANVIVIAIPVSGADGLDSTGQATAIANATGGSVQPGATPAQVANAILAGLSNLPITVTPVAVGCDPLNVSFSPASQTTTSGNQVAFTETIAVPNNAALAGTSVHCTVEFRDGNGNVVGTQSVWVATPIDIDASPDTETNELGTPGQTHTVDAVVSSGAVLVPGATVDFEVLSGPNIGAASSDVTNAAGSASFTYAATQGLAGLGTDTIEACTTSAGGVTVCDEVTKDWVDTTAPVCDCVETNNPSGSNIPKSGPNAGKSGQNPDGFYELVATDAVDPDPEIFVVDTGTGTVFGPFANGTKIKYTQANGADPGVKTGAGDVDWKIKGQGDAAVFAVDASGNASDPVMCLVPQPPK